MLQLSRTASCEVHELLITDQIWVVESDWLIKIQLKVTCVRPFSHHALALPNSGVAKKGSSLIDYPFFSLVAPLHPNGSCVFCIITNDFICNH